jgi:hypothetical protein
MEVSEAAYDDATGRLGGVRWRENSLPRQNVSHVLYVTENAKMSPMSKVVIFSVLYAISVRCGWMPSVDR